jgi:protein gp37
MWLGATVTCQDEAVQAEAVFKKLSNVTKFMYCNPLESKVIFSSLKSVSWVLVGNGDRNEQPEWTWVENIIIQSRMDGCQVYLSPEIKVRPREIPIPTVTS